MSASAVIAEVQQMFTGLPVFLAGSLVASDEYGIDSFADADVWCPTAEMLIAAGQHALDSGCELDDRFSRVWARWLNYGLNWHTNSLKLHTPTDTELNLIYKLNGKKPVNTLAQVLESFDFGLLGVGYNLETNERRDLRPYLFPGFDLDGPLPMMPEKRMNWRAGFISRYNGLREAGRYAKYADRGFDMSLVKDDLVHGYKMAEQYLASTEDDDKLQLAQIYAAIAAHIYADNVDELKAANSILLYSDSLDDIMEALE